MKSKKFLSVFLTLLIMAGVIAAAPVMASAMVHNITDTADLYSVLDYASSGDTIKLSANITYTYPIWIDGNSFTFDLNGKTLNAQCGVYVSDGELKLANPANGAFNVSGDYDGAAVTSTNGSKVEVTNVSSSTDAYAAVSAQNDSEIVVYGNVAHNGTAYGLGGCGVYFAGAASKITINGTLTVAPAGVKDIEFDGTFKTQADFTTPTTKAGYRTYTDGVSTVWVKIPNNTPPHGIFGTNARYTQWWCYILFFLCFGFIWMWF